MAYIVSDDYKEVIYSGDATHKLKLLFNNVEYTDSNIQTEYLKVKSNILSNGENRFSLDNLVSKEAELVIHELDLDDIVEPISISIGTLIDEDNDTYEYVPIGVFNLSEAPTNDKNKTTLKMRDNSVKFDTPYSAEEVIEENEGEATMLQILEDICTKCNVTLATNDFPNADTTVSVWDNTINARQYVMYIAEKAGRIATINRDGELELIDINGQTPYEIPVDLIESYEEGENISISRVVYEDAIRKYEFGDNGGYTVYVNSANPYIVENSEIEEVYNQINGFEMYSMKISKIIGNPAIDPWDLLTFTYNDKDYVFLGQNNLTYNGVIIQNFETQVGTEKKSQENVTLNNEETRFKRVFTRINQAEGTIELNTSEISNVRTELQENYYNIEQTNQLVQTSSTGLTNTFSEAGGNNIFRNTGLWFRETGVSYQVVPKNDLVPSDELIPFSEPYYEFWNGRARRITEDKAISRIGIMLQNNVFSQEQIVANGSYTVSFTYKKLAEVVSFAVIINDIQYDLDATEDTLFEQTIEVSSQHINVKFVCDTDDGVEIYDLMVNAGKVKLAYSQNQNETTTDTVNISKGITITSTDTDTTFRANADGIRTLDTSGNVLTKFTDKGMNTKEMEVENQATICKTLVQDVNGQTWFTRL